MNRTNALCVILLAIATAAFGVLAAPTTAPDAKRLAELGADTTTLRGVVKRYALALKHHPALKMADIIAPGGKDDDEFIANYDALTAAITRLRAAANDKLGAEATQTLAHGFLTQPSETQLLRLFASIDETIPREVQGDSVGLGTAAAEFYAKSGVRKDGTWKIALFPQFTAPHILLAELGDIGGFAAAVAALADDAAAGRLNTVQQFEAGLDAAMRARRESVAGGLDLKALQGKWERKPVGEERAGVARVIGTVSGAHLTWSYIDERGTGYMVMRARMTPRVSGDVRVMTFSDFECTEGPMKGQVGGKGFWKKTPYALTKDTWTEPTDKEPAADTIAWTRLAEKPATKKEDAGEQK
jgi:hypothetical protein